MKTLFLATAAAAILAGVTATAAPQLTIRHAALRLEVVPEDRADVSVTVQQANARLPVTVKTMGDEVVIDGGAGLRVAGCHHMFGAKAVHVWGVGSIRYQDLPLVVARVPKDVRVHAGDAVFGMVGRSKSLELSAGGCGDWVVADTAGPMTLSVSGSGDVHAGSAQRATVHISGSGDVFARNVTGGLDVSISGSGDVRAEQVTGDLAAQVSGSGDVRVAGGRVNDMHARIAGSGDVTFHGVAKTLTASIAGSGDVRVDGVTDHVEKHVAGAGEVYVGK
jgi:Putative auto-transporter adhesin, head GIN domain